MWGDRVASVEINTIISKILKGGLQQGTPHQKAELQHLGIAALFAIIERKIEIRVVTQGIKKSIGIEDLIDRLMKVGLDIDVTQPPFGTLLIKAIMAQQFALAEMLIPHTLKNINAAYEDTGNTALIYAAINNNLSLVKKLLQYDADPKLHNLEGNNAFKASIRHRDEGMVKALLPHETKQSLNEEDCDGDTALAIATSYAWVFAERVIMDAGGIIPGMHLKENTTPSQMRAEFLELLQQNGSVLREGGFASQTMLANIFVEKGEADFPISYLDYAFLNPALRYLMTLAEWACNTYRSKIFIFNSTHNDALHFAPDTNGFYDHYTKDIFCFYEGSLYIDTVSTFFHESMHLVMNIIYRNGCRPYAREDFKKEKKFDGVLFETAARLDNMKSNFMLDTTKEAYDLLCLVYTHYLPHKRASELIARIPQILVRMGIEKGMEWLSQFEELMEYYNTIVWRDMENYIIKIDYSNIGCLRRDRYADRHIPSSSFERIMQMIYERKEEDFILNGLKEAHEELTPDQLAQIEKTALFFKYEPIVIMKWEEYFEKHKRHELFERERKEEQERKCMRLDEIYEQEKKRTHLAQLSQYSKNIRILDALHLDPYNREYLQHWSRQVTYFGGCYYKGYHIPQTIATILEMLEQKSLTDISPEELIEEINKLRTQDSGSWMNFFGSNKRSELMQQIKTMSDDDFRFLATASGNAIKRL